MSIGSALTIAMGFSSCFSLPYNRHRHTESQYSQLCSLTTTYLNRPIDSYTETLTQHTRQNSLSTPPPPPNFPFLVEVGIEEPTPLHRMNLLLLTLQLLQQELDINLVADYLDLNLHDVILYAALIPGQPRLLTRFLVPARLFLAIALLRALGFDFESRLGELSGLFWARFFEHVRV